MIRKSTLIVFVIALLGIGGVFYYQKKHSGPPVSTDTSKPVFSIQAADIQSIALQHMPASDPAIQMARSGDGWDITQPVAMPADTSSAQGIADGLAEASSSQTEPATPDRLKAYGLEPGGLSVSFTLKNGASHKVLIGNKDFSGDSVYAMVDSGQNVVLLPNSLLTSADKTVDDLRDHAILHFDQDQVASADLKNSSGDIQLKKSTSGWSMTQPDNAAADSDSVSSVLSAAATGKMAKVVSEKPGNLAKYGLANPAITLTVTNDIGKSSTLIVGEKDGDNYYARDNARPTIFEIDKATYSKLTQGPGDLLDKTPLHVDETDINEIQIQGSNGAILADRKTGENWQLESPDSVKGKAASAWKIFSALAALHAEEVIVKPSAEITASLAQPAYTLTLTDNSGKKRTLRVSKASGDFIYAQSSDSVSIFKLKKESLADLDIKPADLAS